MYPVDRTTDPFEAYRRARARALCAPPARQDEEIRLGAEPRTVQDGRRTAAVLPGLRHQHPDARADPATGEYRRFEPDVSMADDAEPAAELPLDRGRSVGRTGRSSVRTASPRTTACRWCSTATATGGRVLGGPEIGR
ncbi:hypothetical protein ABTX85_09150 [Streptomyces sp. NPDC096097]|uniref:hypothetical protein n=1 Tax=Streptomyces sp. NPDC096097 TaxID=3155546 RepID=UPI003320ED58